MNRRHTLATGLAIALSTLPLFSSADSGLYLGPEVGYTAYDSDRNLDDEIGYGALLGYQLNSRWATEVEYYFTNPDIDATGADGDVDLEHLSVHARYFLGEGKWRGFTLAGIGAEQTDSDFRDDSDTLFTLGGGVETFIGDSNWLWRVDARGFYTQEASQKDVGVFTTLNYFFGSRAKAAPAVAAAPAAAPQPVAEPASAPAPAPAPIFKTRTVTLNIKFATDSADIAPGYRDDLVRVGDVMKQYQTATITIEGHTDNTGDDAYNKGLSDRRAQSVKNALINDYGVASSRITAIGFGEERPVDTNDTTEGRAKNRRIDAVFTYTEELKPEHQQ